MSHGKCLVLPKFLRSQTEFICRKVLFTGAFQSRICWENRSYGCRLIGVIGLRGQEVPGKPRQWQRHRQGEPGAALCFPGWPSPHWGHFPTESQLLPGGGHQA